MPKNRKHTDQHGDQITSAPTETVAEVAAPVTAPATATKEPEMTADQKAKMYDLMMANKKSDNGVFLTAASIVNKYGAEIQKAVKEATGKDIKKLVLRINAAGDVEVGILRLRKREAGEMTDERRAQLREQLATARKARADGKAADADADDTDDDADAE
jgi:hypothetical protein